MKKNNKKETEQCNMHIVNGSACKHIWDNDTGIKTESRPWAGIKSRWVRTCTKCDKKEYYTNDGMFCGWFSTP